jgi:septal ring factor EnvC (AmiA/AmiB activator)
MIFMNFIIAVIGESFSKVLEYKIAHDYLQRAIMIYELEAHFNTNSLENPIYFPQILIVRTKKQNNQVKNNWQSCIKILKTFIKQQNQKTLDALFKKLKDQKMTLTSSVRQVETNIKAISKDIEKMFGEMRHMAQHHM